jgi:hypothetical protein
MSDDSKEIKDAVNVLFRKLNGMGNNKDVEEAVIEVFSNEHRTLQQAFFGKIILPVIKRCIEAHDNKWYDLRNEAMCKCAKKIEPVIKNEYMPFI